MASGSLRSAVRSDDGWFTIWGLALVLILFAVAGFSIDLWRAFDARRELAGYADAAAVAGASALNESAYRDDVRLELDPGEARRLACENLGDRCGSAQIEPAPGAVTVTLREKVDFTLLGLFDLDGDGLEIKVSGSAEPRRSS